jgi:hypothetical protein
MVMSEEDLIGGPAARKVQAVGREWLLVLGDVLTFGRGGDRDIRFGHDPVDDYVSQEAGALIAADDGLLVRNDSRTQTLWLIAYPGPQKQVDPGEMIGTMPHARARVIVPGRYGVIYTIHLDMRGLSASEGRTQLPVPSASPEPVIVDRLPTRSGPSTLTPRERRLLAALCEPLLIFAGPDAVPATYAEIAQRTGGTKHAVRNTLYNLRDRLSTVDGIPGLRQEGDYDDREGDYRLALARWALASKTTTEADLSLLGPRHPG